MLPHSQEGKPRWKPRRIKLLGNKPIYDADGKPVMWDKHSTGQKHNAVVAPTAKTLPLFPSDHFGIVLELGAPSAADDDEVEEEGYNTP
jgi:hypothetical protein